MSSQETANSQSSQNSTISRLLEKVRLSKINSTGRMFIAVVAFAFVGVAATFMINAAELRQQETVVLDNRKEIRLGDTLSQIEAKLGENVLVTRDKKIYQYPKPNQQQKVEVLIYTDQKKVVAIQVIEGSANQLKVGNGALGLSRQELTARLSRSTRGLQSRQELLNSGGYKLQLNRSSVYYLFDICAGNESVQSVALAYPDSENIFGANKGIDCSVEFN